MRQRSPHRWAAPVAAVVLVGVFKALARPE